MQYLVHSVAVVVVVCVQSVLAKRGMSRVLPGMSVGKRQPSPSPRIYICMCSVPRVPKCGQLVVRNLFWLQSKFFFFCFACCSFTNLTEPKTGLKRNVVVCCYCCCCYLVVVVDVYCNERETFSTRDVAVLFVSYSAYIAFLSMLLFC